MKGNTTWLGLFFAILAIVWFVFFALENLPKIEGGVWLQKSTWLGVGVGALIYACIIPVSAWAWMILLSACGEKRSGFSLAVLMGKTQLAKYIPGNVAQHAARMAFALRSGIPVPAYVTTVFQETVLAALASISVGLLVVAIYPAQWLGVAKIIGEIEWMWIAAVTTFSLAFAALLIFLLGKKHYFTSKHLPRPSAAFVAFGAYSINYAVVGVGLFALARLSGMPSGLGLAALTGAFALSWILGFLAPGAPAGLGVREALMVFLLAGFARPEELLVFVILARVMTMIGDCICFVVAWGVDYVAEGG